MLKTAGFIFLGLISGAGLAYVSSDRVRMVTAGEPRPIDVTQALAELNTRIAELETQLQQPSRSNPQAIEATQAFAEPEEAAATDVVSSAEPSATELRREARRNRSEGARNERLREAGFDDISIQRIRAIESKVQYEAMETRWERQRQDLLEGEQSSRYQARLENRRLLQEELGEAGYERYLSATRGGRDPSVRVRYVMEASPAAQAGFQRGDQIQSYGGYRTYDNLDLQYATVQGERNEPVVVEILRDGQPMTLTIRRGPLGISN